MTFKMNAVLPIRICPPVAQSQSHDRIHLVRHRETLSDPPLTIPSILQAWAFVLPSLPYYDSITIVYQAVFTSWIRFWRRLFAGRRVSGGCIRCWFEWRRCRARVECDGCWRRLSAGGSRSNGERDVRWLSDRENAHSL